MKSALALALVVFAAPPVKPLPKSPPAPPAGPLPMLPSVARVRVEVLDKSVLVLEEVNLPRGDWKNEPLDFYVAFGAPGTPRAIDAQLVPVGDGALEADDSEPGEALAIEHVARRPLSVHPLLGRDTMAGVVVHVKREAMARALSPGNMATLRVRTALDMPDEDAGGARGAVVRLGASQGTPLTLGRVSITAKRGTPAPSRAEAKLCGPEAAPEHLAVGLTPRPAPSSEPLIAPVLAVRHASDDLCVRWWGS